MSDGEVTSKSTILIVDDAPENLRMVSFLLKDDYKVKAANSGEAALRIAFSGNPIDLILLDIMMPGMDGFEVCRQLKEQAATRDIPIIFLSALDDTESEAKGLALGAVDFITKPIHGLGLVLRVKLHTALVQSRRRLEEKQRRLDEELEAARRLQMGLLPSPENCADLGQKYGLDLQGIVESSSMIGGDVWGCFGIDSSRIGIFSFDLSGHGIAAALNSFRLHTLIDNATDIRCDPAAFLKSLSLSLGHLIPRGQYATMFYGIIDCDNDTLTWSGAAAPFPVFVQDGAATLLDTSGTPVAVGDGSVYYNRCLAFPKGASLFLYSDGLTEAERRDGTLFGEDGVKRLASLAVGVESLDKVLENFYAAVQTPLQDDLTAIVVRRLP